MTVAVHPARSFSYADLRDGLEQACSAGFVYVRREGNLSLWCYTARCVHEAAWDAVTVLARGLILDEASGRVVATPFPKFFNLGEGNRGRWFQEKPYEVQEKLDGSLVIAWHHAGRWRTATKGEWGAPAAVLAQRVLDTMDLSPLVPGTTFLFESVGPQNRLVVRYDEPALVLLSAYAADGAEMEPACVRDMAGRLGLRAAEAHRFAGPGELFACADALPRTAEGFVVRFADGTRLKLKGAEYRRIRALIGRCTPLALWQAMAAGDDLDALRRDIPGEYWADFDAIRLLLEGSVTRLTGRVAEAAEAVSGMADKELGLVLEAQPRDVSPFLFAWRRAGGIRGKYRDVLMRAVKPAGNVLDGYVPSHAVRQVLDDET